MFSFTCLYILNNMILKQNILCCFFVAVAGLSFLGCQKRKPGLNAAGLHVNSTSTQQNAISFGNLDVNTPADQLYTIFNQFCKSYFGPHRDTLYHIQAKKTFGKQDSTWIYSSERSAVVSWETDLPSYSYIQYGTTSKYGQKTNVQERPFYLHVHYLKNLKPSSKYHYQIVYLDESGKEIRKSGGTFLTRAASAEIIYISSKTGKPPYILDQENATYVLTEDIVADKTAFDIRAKGITLDLGGKTVVHASSLIEKLNYKDLAHSGVGVRSQGKGRLSGLKIYNGVIRQGNAPNNGDYLAGDNMLKPDPERMKKLAKNLNRGFGNIEIEGFDDVEIAGVTSEYHLPQSYSVRLDSSSGSYNIHHNIFLDKGTQMFDRHGAGGARSMAFQPLSHLKKSENQYRVHHNLIKRTRQNAINVANQVYNNEIYVDSWVVNSFAIQPASQGGQVYNNKMFLTGYYACGVLWADKNLMVKNNFIHMEGVKTMVSKPLKGKRLIETWGEQDILAGMRITNYNKGGTYRENLRYEDNIIIGNARHGSEMRGTEFFSDYSNHGIIFTNNVIALNTDDTLSMASCINTQGAYNDRSKHVPILYINNTLISNNCNIRFGDDYGQGSNHQFVNCRIIKAGNSPAYHTFVFDGRNSVFNHILRDCTFGSGADESDVFWYKTGTLSNYKIQRTLQLTAQPGTKVSIADNTGNLVVADILLPDGRLSLPLTKMVIRPGNWVDGKTEAAVNLQSETKKVTLTPYSIIYSIGSNKKQTATQLDTKAQLNLTL
jgi:hypothetical protein